MTNLYKLLEAKIKLEESILIATTQPTTQNKTKQLGLCGIMIGKTTYYTSTALVPYLRSIGAIPLQH